MTVKQWLDESFDKLSDASVPSAQLDAELLLADALCKDRSWLHAHPEYTLQRSDLRKLDEQIVRRVNHEPIAYIRGKQEFYGREFSVSADTLTPRPETETMVEMALQLLKSYEIQSVADIGTGSGCIIISLDLEFSKIQNLRSKISYIGYDISKSATKIARTNAKKLASSAKFEEVDITGSKEHNWQKAEVIVANLPYVPVDFRINLAAAHEPKYAIFGGKDGLDYYRFMFKQLSDQTRFVLTEALPPQHNQLSEIAEKSGFKLTKTQDLIQLFSRIK